MPMSVATTTTVPTRSPMQRAVWRVRQFGHMVWSRPDQQVDTELRRLLDCDAQWELLARLTPFDRAHHLRVYRWLVAAGETDPDLLRAGLLHDIGKADELVRVNPLHRATCVLLFKLSPTLLERLAGRRSRFWHGLWLNVHHAEAGAMLAREAGASEQCCALIRAHAVPGPHADPLLNALIAADNASIR